MYVVRHLQFAVRIGRQVAPGSERTFVLVARWRILAPGGQYITIVTKWVHTAAHSHQSRPQRAHALVIKNGKIVIIIVTCFYLFRSFCRWLELTIEY